eukprot:tig00020610_g11964.t1
MAAPMQTSPTPKPAAESTEALGRSAVHMIIEFLRKHSTYDLMPESAKVVVLDCDLPLRTAFQALLEHETHAAVLWDSRLQDYVGIVTVTDFCDILRHFYKAGPTTIGAAIDEQSIRNWRERLIETRPRELISVDPEDNVLEACFKLQHHKIHRLPIIERTEHNVVLHIITHSRILGFIVRNLRGCHEILDRPVHELGIGTYSNIVSVGKDMPVIQVLNLLSERRISAAPIVDEHGAVMDVFSRTDVPALARDRTFSNLDHPIIRAVHHSARTPGVQLCRKEDTLRAVFEKLALANVHRLIAIDANRRVEGIISVTDIFSFFVNSIPNSQ